MQIQQLQVALHTVNIQGVAKNSQYQPWVFFRMILLRQNFATFVNGKIFSAKFSPSKISPPPVDRGCTISNFRGTNVSGLKKRHSGD